MKSKYINICLAFLLITINACQNDDFNPAGHHKPQLVTNYNQSQLNARVRVPEYEEMLSFYNVAGTDATNGRTKGTQTESQQNYAMLLRAEVEPPVFNGNKLQATHVEIEGNRAFVSYNTEGEDYLGGIEIYDISDIKHPVLKSQIVIDGSDFSAVTAHDNKVYVAGAQYTQEEGDLSSPAIVEILELENDQVSGDPVILDVTGFVATDVKVHGDKLYVTSGTNGGLSIYDVNTLALLDKKDLDDARSIAFDGDQYVVMQGTPARVKVYNTADNSLLKDYTIGGANVPASKSIVDMKNDLIFVPTGKEGLKVVEAQTGEEKLMLPLPEMEDVDPDFLVTNGVSVNEEKIFIANGAAGMYVGEEQDDQIRILGNVYFNASTNYVKSQGNVIFVATGSGGLKILEIVEYDPGNGDYIPIGEWDDEGVPSYLCEQGSSIDQGLISRYFSQFVSMHDITLTHPEWFTADAITDLHLKEDTDLSLTFLHETAGMKNTLGYYSYETGQVPATSSEIKNLTVLFPNVSYKGSGGGLTRGDKICLDDLKAGTTLGFFLNAEGWNPTHLTKGYYTHYTTLQYNITHPAGLKQNSLLLYDKESGTIILSYEDVRRPGGDKDFDDAVFVIKLSNPDAVDTSLLSKL